jgi:hypothetical protein
VSVQFSVCLRGRPRGRWSRRNPNTDATPAVHVLRTNTDLPADQVALQFKRLYLWAWISFRRSSAANSFGPRLVRSIRNVFFDGRLKPGPNKTGDLSIPVSSANLNTLRTF